MMYGYGNGCGGTGMFGGWHFIIPIIILVIIIYAIYKIITSNTNQVSYSALDELNRKFVNGELTEKEYFEKKAVLKKK